MAENRTDSGGPIEVASAGDDPKIPIGGDGAYSLHGLGLRLLWNAALEILAIIYLVQLPRQSSSAAFPRIVGGGLLALVTVDLIRTIIGAWTRRGSIAHVLPSTNRSPSGESKQSVGGTPTRSRDAVDVRLLVRAIMVLAAYIGLWTELGFVLDTLLVVGLTPPLFGLPRKWVPICLLAGCAIAAVVSLLVQVGGVVQLPTGVLPWSLP